MTDDRQPLPRVLIFAFLGAPIKPGDYSRLIGVNFAKVGEVIVVLHAKPYFGGSTRGSSCLAMSPAPESEM